VSFTGALQELHRRFLVTFTASALQELYSRRFTVRRRAGAERTECTKGGGGGGGGAWGDGSRVGAGRGSAPPAAA
jgi:hypothetical protein